MKKEEKMWAILLQLGSNRLGKPGECCPHPREEEEAYHTYVYSDRETWRNITEYLPSCGINTVVIDIGEALKLDSHPELAIPGSWEKQEFIEELHRLRSLGLTPIPMYNFSCTHNAWMQEYGNMVGTEIYNQVCDDIVCEAIEIFDKPEFFHLGLNNEIPQYQEHYPVKIVRAWGQKTQDALRLFRICMERGVRPWIWADLETVEAFGGKERFRENIPKEVLLSNRCFKMVVRVDGQEDAPTTKLYRELAEWGYEQIPTCYRWAWPFNAKQTLSYCRDYVEPCGIRGFMTASFLPVTEDYYYGLLYDADLLSEAKKYVYSEGDEYGYK